MGVFGMKGGKFLELLARTDAREARGPPLYVPWDIATI